MAVQTHHPSNPPSPDSRSRAQNGLRMWPNRDRLSGHFFPSALQQQQQQQQPPSDDREQHPSASNNVHPLIRDRPHVEPAYNARWAVNVSLPSMAAAAASLPQHPGLPDPAFMAVPSPSLAGLQIPTNQGFRMYNSAGASTSGRPENVSAQSIVGSPFSQELLAHFRNHNLEISTILNNYKNMIRVGIAETETRQWRSLLSMLEQKAFKRLREKDAELESANRRNSELEEKVLQLCSENQMWFNLASQNEALASNLKTTLEQVMQQNASAEAPHPPVMEGYGDTDGSLLPANDAHSCFRIEDLLVDPQVDGDATVQRNYEQVRRRMVCKVCHEKDISVLVLNCRHLCLCDDCETKVDRCPICNNMKGGSIHILMP